MCDSDADNDNIKNPEDNCWIVPNPDQQDSDHDGKGDACDGDNDGDKTPDDKDNADNNTEISVTDFTGVTIIVLDNKRDDEDSLKYEINDEGREIIQHNNAPAAMVVGKHRLNGFDFEGTIQVTGGDNDFIGFVFAVQVSTPVCAWRHNWGDCVL